MLVAEIEELLHRGLGACPGNSQLSEDEKEA
jgi:hypothetical protein